jgi:predicted anti-sigma-YlaC factor YlaD
MTACREQDEWLTLFATEALEPEDETRVRAHLESCAACRAEVEAQREVLGLAALPPLSARERAVVAALPRTTADAWLSTRLQQAARMRTTGALMAAAAVALLALGPVIQHPTPPRPQPAANEEQPTGLAEETSSALEQWASSDPLAEALDSADVALEELEDDAEPLDSEVEDFLSYPNTGESP